MERNLYLDNLKFVLIFFVVLGHFANLNRNIPIFGVLNNIIYSFHMPLFIFVSGYLSKKVVRQRKKEIDQVLYSYFIFEILNLIFTKLTSIGYGGIHIFTPTGQNWYLLGLFFWRLFLPYCFLFKKNTSFIITVILALSVGFYDDFNTFLGLYRIIYFMPFFVLGSYCNDINLLKNKYNRFRSLFILLLFVSFIFITILSLYNIEFSKAIAYAFTPFKGYNSQSNFELLLRFFLRIIGFITSILIIFLFLFIIPEKKTFFTHFGEHTLNVFLLHMFIVLPINLFFVKFNLDLFFMVLTSILTSALITVTLSSNFIHRIMAPLTHAIPLSTINKLKVQRTFN